MMRIAYVSNDEVNRELAARMAAEFGAAFCTLHPHGPAPEGKFDVVLYNLDDLATHDQALLVEGLRRGAGQRPTGVHGYDVTDEQESNLKKIGVAASRRLHRDLLRGLCTAALQHHQPPAPDESSTDLTWVSLEK
jgi:hypothetical protein